MNIFFTIQDFLSNYSPLHFNGEFIFIFCTYFINYGITYFAYYWTDKPYNRICLYTLFIPLFIILKTIFGTTFFVEYSHIDVFWIITFVLSMVLYFLMELGYFFQCSQAYHTFKKIEETKTVFTDRYVILTLGLLVTLLNFVRI